MTLVLAWFAVVALAGGQAGAQAPADEVEQVIAKFLIPFSSGNVGEFIDYFADEATLFMPPSAARASAIRVQGKAGIRREFEALFGTDPAAGAQRPVIRPQDLTIQRLNDVAIVTFHLGTEASRGRRTFVLHRTGSGWRIAHLHASTFPAR
jgi:ketosteroid isomerase-like protein